MLKVQAFGSSASRTRRRKDGSRAVGGDGPLRFDGGRTRRGRLRPDRVVAAEHLFFKAPPFHEENARLRLFGARGVDGKESRELLDRRFRLLQGKRVRIRDEEIDFRILERDRQTASVQIKDLNVLFPECVAKRFERIANPGGVLRAPEFGLDPETNRATDAHALRDDRHADQGVRGNFGVFDGLGLRNFRHVGTNRRPDVARRIPMPMKELPAGGAAKGAGA